MVDVHEPEIRSYNMSRIKGKDTKPEVAMRLTNFASIDPFHQARGISGLLGGAKQCQPIWYEFAVNGNELLFESERSPCRPLRQLIHTLLQ